MKLSIPALAAVAAGIVAASSCGDPTAVKAQFETASDTVEVFALSGTPATLPSAIRTRTLSVVRVGGDFNFDIAWDVGAAGEAVVHTVRAVASEQVPARRVGLQLSDSPFDAIVEAPVSGYKYDSSLVVPMGKVLLVDSFDPSCPSFSILGQNIRAKIQLDSVVVSRRALYMRILSNPNCGFRDLVPGLPRN